MVVYIISFLCIAFYGYIYSLNKAKYKKGFMKFTFLILAMLSALRSYEVGVDTKTYVSIFHNLSTDGYSRMEPGFRLYCRLLYRISSNPRILLVVTSFFCIGAISYFIYKNSKAVFLSVLLLIFFNYYFSSMNLLRQYIAIAIGCIAYSFFRKRKLFFFLFVLLAASFHYSAIVIILWMLVPYFKKINKKIVLIAMVAGYIVYQNLDQLILLAIRLFPQYASMYIGSMYFEGNTFGSYFEMAKMVLALCLVIYFGKKSNSDDSFFYSTILSMALIAQLLSLKINIMARFMPYFSIFEIIAIPNVLAASSKKKTAAVVALAVVFVAVAYFVIVSVFRPGWTGAIPYRFWYQGTYIK